MASLKYGIKIYSAYFVPYASFVIEERWYATEEQRDKEIRDLTRSLGSFTNKRVQKIERKVDGS